MTNRTRIAPLVLIALAGLANLDAPASAQDGNRPERRASQEERPLLSGPRVREQRVPGTESGFSADSQASGRTSGQPVPAQVFRNAIGKLMAEDAPLEIRLSPEQRERITAHVRAFEQQIRRKQGEAGRRAGGANDRATDRLSARTTDRGAPRSDRGQDNRRQQSERPQSDRARGDQARPERTRPGTARSEADDKSPQRSDRASSRGDMARALSGLQNRIWVELSAAQQAHVGKAIEAWRAKATTERMGRTQERYRKEIGARFDEMESDRPQRQERNNATSEKGPQELRRWFSSLPENAQQRLRERMASMPVERREALVARAIDMSPEERAELVRRLLQSADSESPRRSPR